jgi:Carboxypeptidase regulatory-like domain/TonB dependent receptor
MHRCAIRLGPLLLLVSALLPGQVDRTAITGTVSDQQGNRVPQCAVRAIERGTGFQRDTVTTSQGTYELPGLPPGVYSVRFSKTGFALFTADNVDQLVGATRTLNVTLDLARGQQQATVVEPLIALDKVNATIGAAVEQAQIDDLPINGRNWATLTSLTPGAIDNGAGDQRTIRFAGHGLDDNNLTLDGIDATAVYNQEQREYMRLNIPLDSIEEFQVQAQNFGADTQNGTAGGQVSVVSPSGSNAFHGDAFDFYRDNALDARSPFDGPSPDPFLLNQFGAALGGPIAHGKTFFHVNYEGLRQRLDGTQIGLVPSPSFAAQAAVTSPAILPLLNAYPAGTSPTSNPSVWQYDAPGRQVDNEDSGMVRIDHYFDPRTTAFIRFNADEAVESIPTGNLTVKELFDTKFNNGAAALSHVFTPSLINEIKFGVNQTIYHTANVSQVPMTVAVSGFSSLTGASTTDYPSKTFDLIDDLSWAKGKHILKFGYETRWILMNQGTSNSGTLTYNSAAALLANTMGSAAYTAILPLVRQRKAQYFAYAQDEWKATPNLTITAGLRYNYFNALHAIGDDDDPFDFATCGGYCPRTDSFFHPRALDFDPRLGIAWAHGDTVVRVGAGIYHTDGQEDDQNLPISNTVDRYSFSNTAFPTLSYPLSPFLAYAEAGGLGVVSPRDLDRNRKDDYVAAWTASLQRKLPFHIIGTATYLGNKATHVLTTTYVNLINPATGVAPYPAFGPVSWRGDAGNSTFEGFEFNARRAFQHGFLLSANYMWSHSINDGSIGGGESDTPQDSFCRECDKASSDDDVRQVFNLSAVYQLPSPAVARRVLGGWALSAIGTAQTGLPVNITVDRSNASVPGDFAISGEERPNYVPGVSLTPPGGSTPLEWINPAAFAVPAANTFGDLGRNAFRAPRISQLDLALSKDIPLTERMRLRFRADVFNIFNRAQFGAPNADISQVNFGEITSTISNYATGRGTPREFQLSAKISF